MQKDVNEIRIQSDVVSYKESYATELLPVLVGTGIWEGELIFVIIKVGEIWTVVINNSPYINVKIDTIFVQKMKKILEELCQFGPKTGKDKWN